MTSQLTQLNITANMTQYHSWHITANMTRHDSWQNSTLPFTWLHTTVEMTWQSQFTHDITVHMTFTCSTCATSRPAHQQSDSTYSLPTILSYILKTSQPSSATYLKPPNHHQLHTASQPSSATYLKPPNHHQLHTASHHPQLHTASQPSSAQTFTCSTCGAYRSAHQQPDPQPPKGLQEMKLSLPKALSVWDQPALAAMQCSMGTQKFPNNPVQRRRGVWGISRNVMFSGNQGGNQ